MTNTFDVIILTCVSDTVPSRGIGAYRIAHSLRSNGYTVQVIDFTDWFTTEELIAVTKKCIGPNTRMIGVSSTFYQKVHNKLNKGNNTTEWLRTVVGIPDNVIDTVKSLKLIYPTIEYAIGGANSFMYENDTLFDVVFHSYSDTAILEYLGSNRLWKKQLGRNIVEGEEHPVNVETMTHKWESNDYIQPRESLPIEISRGCIFKCKFCNFQLIGKKKLDYIRHPDCIKQEFIENYKKYGTTNYMFTDDTFNDSTYKLEQLHKTIISLPFKIKFTTYLRLDLLHAHPEQIPLLKEMGLASAFFGIESFNEKTSKAIGKGLSVNKVKDTLLKIKYDYFPTDFSMLCSFIVGLPYDSLQGIEESFNWTQQHDINTIWMPLFIRQDARYKSEIDLNYEKYGYKINQLNHWSNDYTNFSEAVTAAAEFQAKTNNTRSTWPLFAMASLNHWSLEDLIKTRIKDIDMTLVEKGRDKFVNNYKKMLFDGLNFIPV